MCIICVSPKGVRQPNPATLKIMFRNNPHGAGYMFAQNGQVHIRKGFMTFEDFQSAIRQEHFTARDSVVYHFRISTQAGITPEMTHPFPLSNQPLQLQALECTSPFGIAHNGIIPLTADASNRRFSDTAIFVAEYLTRLIRRPEDLENPAITRMIYNLAQSKLAIMDGSGRVTTVGRFLDEHGLLFSNTSFACLRWAI